MVPISRRDVLTGLAATGAASIVTAPSEERQSVAAANVDSRSANERRQHADALIRYFATNAPQLLRAPDGVLKHPSIAPSLPGKVYSTSLWDWDTLWTSQGLFRLAALQHDEMLKQSLCEHVSGSLLNFLEHASPEGQIPIVMTADNPNPFRVVGKNSTKNGRHRCGSCSKSRRRKKCVRNA
jgi:putative isomerase